MNPNSCQLAAYFSKHVIDFRQVRMPNEMLKTRVQALLRDSIKLLCQNSIDFTARITIQALIGITVDDSEVLLVNVHEQVDKSNASNIAPSTSNNPRRSDAAKVSKKRKNSVVPWSTSVRDIKEECYDYDCIAIPDNAKPNLDAIREKQDGENVVDLEELDENYAEDEDYSEYTNQEQEQEYDQEQEQEYDESTAAEYNDGNDQYFEPTIKNEYGQNKNEYALLQSKQSLANFVRSDVGTAKRRKTVRTTVGPRPRQPQRLPAAQMGGDGDQESYPDSYETAAQGSWGGSTSSVLSTERNQVFTCSICGQSIRHLSSFLRHKKQHDGTVFRCDLCGKVVNRRDSLVAHRRRCELNSAAS